MLVSSFTTICTLTQASTGKKENVTRLPKARFTTYLDMIFDVVVGWPLDQSENDWGN